MTDVASYQRAKALVERLLTKKGQPVTLVKAGNPSTGYDENGDPISATPDVTISGVGASLNYSINEIDGTVIQSGDCKLLFQGDGSPEVDMTVTLSSIKWRIVAVMPLSPGGIVVMYELQLRK